MRDKIEGILDKPSRTCTHESHGLDTQGEGAENSVCIPIEQCAGAVISLLTVCRLSFIIAVLCRSFLAIHLGTVDSK